MQGLRQAAQRRLQGCDLRAALPVPKTDPLGVWMKAAHLTMLRPRGVAVALSTMLAVAGGALTGCGGGPNASERPLTVLFIDISQSTENARNRGGLYEQWANKATKQTALAQGTLYAAWADANTVATSIWEIDGHRFKPATSGSSQIIDGELRKQADDLAQQLSALVSSRSSRGSDLLGALQMASQLFGNYPQRPRSLILLTDGAVNVGGVNLRAPPKNAVVIKHIIARLRKRGELPDLTGGKGEPVRVWIAGLGHGLGREKSRGAIAFWQALIPHTHGELVAYNSGTLRLANFP